MIDYHKCYYVKEREKQSIKFDLIYTSKIDLPAYYYANITHFSMKLKSINKTSYLINIKNKTATFKRTYLIFYINKCMPCMHFIY